MTEEYKRFYYQQKPLLNSHVVAKKVRRQVLGPSVRAVVERGNTQSSRLPAEMGTKLGDKHPKRFRRVQGELNFEEIPSSVQDSEILGS